MQTPPETPQGTSLADIISTHQPNQVEAVNLPSGKRPFVAHSDGTGMSFQEFRPQAMQDSYLSPEDRQHLNAELLTSAILREGQRFQDENFIHQPKTRRGKPVDPEISQENQRDMVNRAEVTYPYLNAKGQITEYTAPLGELLQELSDRQQSPNTLSEGLAKDTPPEERTLAFLQAGPESIRNFMHNADLGYDAPTAFQKLQPHEVTPSRGSMHVNYSPNMAAPETREPTQPEPPEKPLLCEFHSHTTMSDGELSPKELVDFYGQRGFDVLAITDHIVDSGVKKKSVNVLREDDFPRYLETVEELKPYAQEKYGMQVMAGIEFTRSHPVDGKATHLLALDLKEPINPDLPLEQTMEEIHKQGGLVVAAHPHEGPQHNTTELWDNRHSKGFGEIVDAWESVRRGTVYIPINKSNYSKLADSDFHTPQHINVPHTLLQSGKAPDQIKEAIREGRTSITHRNRAEGVPDPARTFPGTAHERAALKPTGKTQQAEQGK